MPFRPGNNYAFMRTAGSGKNAYCRSWYVICIFLFFIVNMHKLTLSLTIVADRTRVPLYIVSAADLGSHPSTVEQKLKSALNCCYLWNAVLLLDEADVFMETRSSDSLDRNELVSSMSHSLISEPGMLSTDMN